MSKAIDKIYIVEADNSEDGWIALFANEELDKCVFAMKCLSKQNITTLDKLRIRLRITTVEYKDLNDLIDVPNADYDKKLTVQ